MDNHDDYDEKADDDDELSTFVFSLSDERTFPPCTTRLKKSRNCVHTFSVFETENPQKPSKPEQHGRSSSKHLEVKYE